MERERLPLRSVYNDAERWYAAYTCANHEKLVAQRLAARSVAHFLPTYESLRRWKDRRVRLEMPLFPGYVFVRMALCDRLRVLQVPGVAHLVGFGGTPVALPQEEMDALRNGLAAGGRIAPHPYLSAGRRVRVTSGPLAGLEGILVRRKSEARLVVSLELIQRSVQVEVEEADLRPVVGCREQARLGRGLAAGGGVGLENRSLRLVPRPKKHYSLEQLHLLDNTYYDLGECSR